MTDNDRTDNQRSNYNRDRDRRRRDDRGRSGATGKRYGQRGKDQHDQRRLSPTRKGFREDRMDRRAAEPDLPDGLDLNALDPMIRQDLRVLSRDNAEAVGKHILMVIELIDDAPELALAHARAAKDRAGRVSVAREVNGVAAYHNGEWKEALAELRAARRMTGGPGLLPLMADCERGLGRPEKAIELGNSDDARQLSRDDAIELAIVVAGARHDLQQHDSAVLTLERAEPDQRDTSFYGLRLAYAYANALAEAGRIREAKEWFSAVVDNDEDELTDAADRLDELG